MPDNNAISSRIKDSRIKKGWSQAELAQETGVTQPTVANWESGSHVPRPAVLERIGAALNVEALWLLSGEISWSAQSLQAYLSRPIQHLPVFSWPGANAGWQSETPHTYMPFATSRSDLFAILMPGNAPEDGEKDSITVTICAPIDGGKPGWQWLCSVEGVPVTSKTKPKDIGARAIGRIMGTLKIYK